MEKKYQIFISSTYVDLKEERRKVKDTILSMFQFPIGMEMFSADDEEQWKIIKETIDSSDYYVLIIGHRYGSLIEHGRYSGVSFTEKEYDYAVSRKIPVLAFLIDKNVPVLPENIEIDSKKRKKLEDFIQKVKSGRVVEWWTTKDDLANKVMNSLNKQIKKDRRPGWVRSDFTSIIRNERISTKIIGKYTVVYFSAFNNKPCRIIFSELEIFSNGKAKLLNDFDTQTGKNPDYTYLGYSTCTDSNIFIQMDNSVSNEKITINLINSVGNHMRFIGLMFASSPNNIPVCVKIACLNNKISHDVNYNIIKDILTSENRVFNNNVYTFEEEAKLRFYSNDIFLNN